MKVKDLIKDLQECDPEAWVIMSKDGEGNEHSPLAEIGDTYVYTPTSSWSGEIFDTRWTAEEACLDEKEHKKMLKRKTCVVLHPIN